MILQILNGNRFRQVISSLFRAESEPVSDRGPLATPADDWAGLARPQPLHWTLGSTRHLPGMEPPWQANMTACNHQFFDMLDEGPALLIAGDDANIGLCYDWLNEAMIGALRCRSFSAASAVLRQGAPRVSLLIIDIDSLGSINTAIDHIMALRDTQPCIPLILLSAEVHASDFSTERLRICDVTLRAPVSHSSLELAIVEAARNNLVWCGRDED